MYSSNYYIRTRKRQYRCDTRSIIPVESFQEVSGQFLTISHSRFARSGQKMIGNFVWSFHRNPAPKKSSESKLNRSEPTGPQWSGHFFYQINNAYIPCIYSYILFHTIIRNRHNIEHVLRQFKKHKQLIIRSIVLWILSIARLVISSYPECIRTWKNLWLYFTPYSFPFTSSILIFKIFVVPSNIYMKSFQSSLSWLGKFEFIHNRWSHGCYWAYFELLLHQTVNDMEFRYAIGKIKTTPV